MRSKEEHSIEAVVDPSIFMTKAMIASRILNEGKKKPYLDDRYRKFGKFVPKSRELSQARFYVELTLFKYKLFISI